MKDNNILIQKVSLRSNTIGNFANWQALINAKLATFPGFVSLEFVAPENSSQEWIIVQRFSSSEELNNWVLSRDFINLKENLRDRFAQGEISEELSGISRSSSGVTEVFITEVSPEKDNEYRKWMGKIHQVEAKFPGFKGAYVQAPSKAGGRNWLTLLQFDTQENLDNWLNSPERQNVLNESKTLIASIESHRVFSPFAGWFKSIEQMFGQTPPVWKQTLIVLLVLYPIVMLEILFLNPLISGLNLSLATFIGNAISVSLVSWPMVPVAIYCLGWWLVPKSGFYLRNTIIGTLVVIFLYIIEILVFW